MFDEYIPKKQAIILIVLGWYLFNMLVSNSMWASVLLGFCLVFLVPGYSWVDCLVKTEDQIERFVLAVALSISLVILSIVLMNLVLKIQITQMSVFADIALISLAGLLWENKKKLGIPTNTLPGLRSKQTRKSMKKKKSKKRKK